MGKVDIGQILVSNLKARMEKSASLQTQAALAKRSGVSPSHLSEIMNGISSVTINKVAELANALGCEAWELLTNSEETRKAALSKMIMGSGLGEDTLPPTPPPKKRKKPGNPKQDGAK